MTFRLTWGLTPYLGPGHTIRVEEVEGPKALVLVQTGTPFSIATADERDTSSLLKKPKGFPEGRSYYKFSGGEFRCELVPRSYLTVTVPRIDRWTGEENWGSWSSASVTIFMDHTGEIHRCEMGYVWAWLREYRDRMSRLFLVGCVDNPEVQVALQIMKDWGVDLRFVLNDEGVRMKSGEQPHSWSGRGEETLEGKVVYTVGFEDMKFLELLKAEGAAEPRAIITHHNEDGMENPFESADAFEDSLLDFVVVACFRTRNPRYSVSSDPCWLPDGWERPIMVGTSDEVWGEVWEPEEGESIEKSDIYSVVDEYCDEAGNGCIYCLPIPKKYMDLYRELSRK